MEACIAMLPPRLYAPRLPPTPIAAMVFFEFKSIAAAELVLLKTYGTNAAAAPKVDDRCRKLRRDWSVFLRLVLLCDAMLGLS